MGCGRPGTLAPAALAALAILAPADVRETRHEDGSLATRYEVAPDAAGGLVADGAFESWRPDGSRLAKGTMRAGQRAGDWTFYWPNGKHQARGEYEAGLRVGTWRFFRPLGPLEAQGEFEAGRRSGRWVFRNAEREEDEGRSGIARVLELRHGLVRARGELCGREEGRWTFWWPDGRPMLRGSFAGGEPVGTWRYFPPPAEDGEPPAPVVLEAPEPDLDPEPDEVDATWPEEGPRELSRAELGAGLVDSTRLPVLRTALSWLEGADPADLRELEGTVEPLLGLALEGPPESAVARRALALLAPLDLDPAAPDLERLTRAWLLRSLTLSTPRLARVLEHLGPAADPLWCTPAEAERLRARAERQGFGYRSSRPWESPGAIEPAQAALRWLAAAQRADGLWDGGRPAFDVGTSAWVLLAFLACPDRLWPVPSRAALDRGLAALIALQDEGTGRISGPTSPAPTDADHQHVLATWALVEANLIGVGPPCARVTLRALEHLLDLRDPQGLWEGSRGGPALTGTALHVLGLAGFSDRLAQEAVRSWLDVPGAGSASTLRLLHSVLILREREQLDPQILAAAVDPAHVPARASWDLVDLHDRTLLAFQTGGAPWKRWNDELRPRIAAAVARDGPQAGSCEPSGPAGELLGRCGATALIALCLLVYDRYPR